MTDKQQELQYKLNQRLLGLADGDGFTLSLSTVLQNRLSEDNVQQFEELVIQFYTDMKEILQ